jgi:hypothetical protein
VTATSVTTPSLAAGIIQADDVRTKGPIADVRAFGAWGNGDHDDTDAIKAAIHHAKAMGGVVYLPAGKYKCGPLQLEGVAMVGSGIQSDPSGGVPNRGTQLIICSGNTFHAGGGPTASLHGVIVTEADAASIQGNQFFGCTQAVSCRSSHEAHERELPSRGARER